ncbi:MAG: NAD(P)H-binding protein [Xanthomonadaceae bacterium]|jgi:uncharacterized protein YbjT (DUF2867 family)|nr:NAD(P)H-binding protein [Xanthomonadaceae bacterium]
MSARDAVIAGATGLVGAELLRLLAWDDTYTRVLALARRDLPLQHPRIEARPARFEALDAALAGARPGADVFCCLGTTIRTAGSREAFRAVDHGMVVALARWAKRHRARRFLLVSALGADPASRVFYNRTKGEAERDARAEGPASVVVLRPSLLDGERAERRFGEQLSLRLARPLAGLIPAAWRPVHARDVAAAIWDAARVESPPAVIESAAMLGAAAR